MFTGVGEWLTRRAALTPGRTGLVDFATGARYTWNDLDTRARALAAVFTEQHGVRLGDRIAILAANSPEYLDALFASALIGAILVPLNWRLTAPELRTILRDCVPTLLLHDDAHAALATAALELLELPAYPRPALVPLASFPGLDVSLAARATPFASHDGEEPLLILYTSGTTGVPKGALLSHRMVTWNAINTQISWGVRETDSTPTFAPFFHAGGINVLTTPLYHCGGTVVLLRSGDPATVLSAIEREQCTIVFAVPTVFQTLIDAPEFASTDLSSVRFCVTGGSTCPTPLIQRYAETGLVFRQGYGLTEVGVNCFSLAPEDALRKAGSVGKPVFHSAARIVNDEDKDVADGETGELILAGPHVCSGYYNRPDATADALRDGWWHTGDLARRDGDGYYYIAGRKKDMYISGGENVYPAEVEGVLLAHPAVADAAVISQPDARWGEVGVAVVVPGGSEPLTEAGVLGWCEGRLARFKQPRRIVFVDTLPRNAMGKVQKGELRARFTPAPVETGVHPAEGGSR